MASKDERVWPTATEAPWAAVDVETTGLSPREHEVLSVAVVLAGPSMEEVCSLTMKILPSRLHAAQGEALVVSGFDEALWDREAVSKLTAAERLYEILRGRKLVAHNLDFDRGFLAAAIRECGRGAPWGIGHVCTLKAAREARKLGKLASLSAALVDVAKALRIPLEREEGAAHDPLDDARAALGVARSFRLSGIIRV